MTRLTWLMKLWMWQCTRVFNVRHQQTLVSMSVRLQVQDVLKALHYLCNCFKWNLTNVCCQHNHSQITQQTAAYPPQSSLPISDGQTHLNITQSHTPKPSHKINQELTQTATLNIQDTFRPEFPGLKWLITKVNKTQPNILHVLHEGSHWCKVSAWTLHTILHKCSVYSNMHSHWHDQVKLGKPEVVFIVLFPNFLVNFSQHNNFPAAKSSVTVAGEWWGA